MRAEGKSWQCNACGESVESQFDTCWQCGCDEQGDADPGFPRFDVIDPHCRVCTYPLAGLGSDRCPECGESFDRFTVHEAIGISESLRSLVKEDTQLLCPTCQVNITLFDHYCPDCNTCVGQFSPALPLEAIRFEVEFYGRLWERVWDKTRYTFWRRSILFVLFVLLLLGLRDSIGGVETGVPIISYLMVFFIPFFCFKGVEKFRAGFWHCDVCGYDLRGNLDAITCPECGEELGNKLTSQNFMIEHDPQMSKPPLDTDWSSLGMPLDKVVLVDHDPAWHDVFENEAKRILHACGDDLVNVQHIGSTSVPGLCAKPILDLMPGLKSLDDAAAIIKPLESLGYVCRGELGIPGRRFFYLNIDGQRVAHVHAFAIDHREYERHLMFCEYLRSNPDAAQRYAELKRQLATTHENDRDAYTDAKTALITEMESEALAARDVV